MAYAVYPHDPYYHLTAAGGYRTLCGLYTKGRTQKVESRLPPASVSAEMPPSSYLPCFWCYAAESAHDEQAGRETGHAPRE